jgi:phosphate transport system substrate-binding protein
VSPPRQAQTLLRFHGSNTIGGKLLPALAEAYMSQAGYANIHAVPGPKEDESFIVGEQNGAQKQIEIQAHGSKTAFEDLKNGSCDIGMSSRPIKPEERQALLPVLGDLTSSASEHVLALDGIAVIVHPANLVRTLTLAQLADIFSGAVTDWSQVGGRAGTIVVYARDEKSGTWDFFNEMVLKKYHKSLAASARRFENSEMLSGVVGGDPGGIGFIGLNYVGSNKVVGLADTGVEARKPSLLTIKTEDYMLARRLFLYTAEKPSNPEVFKFIQYAVGPSAQPVVASTGLVNLDVTPLRQVDSDDPRKQSERWTKLTTGAVEIPTRFRFRANSDELDNRAQRDIGRIVYLLSQGGYLGKEVILIGFADKSGSALRNVELSQSRADIVKKMLAEEGVAVRASVGVGATAFVAPNDTEEQREKNRRVEVWVK